MRSCTRTELILILATAAFIVAAVCVGVSGGGAGVYVEKGGAVSAVPTAPETPEAPSLADVSPIDINTADASTLALLPGVGDTLASRIVDYREAHGSFAAVEDIMNVSGIGEGKFAEIRDYITTGGTP